MNLYMIRTWSADGTWFKTHYCYGRNVFDALRNALPARLKGSKRTEVWR